MLFNIPEMQKLFLILPGLTPDEVWGQPLNGGGHPIKLQLRSEPWEVVRIDLTDDPLKVYSLVSPKKFQPKDRLFRSSGKKLKFGKGQKILVPAAPASGKTTLLRNLGDAITKSGKANITNILIDERPEEALYGKTINLSYMRAPKDIIYGVTSSLGQVMERAIEKGTDEVIFIDSLTRLVQVASTVIQTDYPDLPSGTGGISLYARKYVRQIFGLGNRLQRGSLTIIGTCLIGGSTLEDTIYKDLQGVSTSEIFIKKVDNEPTIDPIKSYVRDMHRIT